MKRRGREGQNHQSLGHRHQVKVVLTQDTPLGHLLLHTEAHQATHAHWQTLVEEACLLFSSREQVGLGS